MPSVIPIPESGSLAGENTPVSVVVPGAWWTELTYEGTASCISGMRVCVSLGKSYRTGIILSVGEKIPVFSGVLKPLYALLDMDNVFADGTLELIAWAGKTWFCGTGLAMKALMPKPLLAGDPLEKFPEIERKPDHLMDDLFLYDPEDRHRMSRYREFAEQAGHQQRCLLLFPQHETAEKLWDSFPPELRGKGVLWPRVFGKKTWELWKETQNGAFDYIIGAQSAAMAPMPALTRLVIEDESSGAWRTVPYPHINMRSLLAKRARLLKAQLVMGGRMPSARVSLRMKSVGMNGVSDKRLIFVDLWKARKANTEAIAAPLSVSSALVRETLKSLETGRWSLWILDRKGYAGEIACADCGASVVCETCKVAMRWEQGKGHLTCMVCGRYEKVPDRCPFCSGHFLQGKKPGLESLHGETWGIEERGGPVIYLPEQKGRPASLVKKLSQQYPQGGLVLGTRAALALCESLSVGMIGWIDADFESQAGEFDARVRAFSMLWESCWRGDNPESRVIVVQSRYAGKEWHIGLRAGWKYFWDRELHERKEMGFPPFMPLLYITLPSGMRSFFTKQLNGLGIQHWFSEDGGCWLRTRKLDTVRELLAPSFEIRQHRGGRPRISIWYD